MCIHWQRLQFLALYLMKILISNSALQMPNKDGDSRYYYLSQQHPLWILDDQVSSMERDVSHTTFTTTAKPQYPTYYLKYQRKKMVPNAGFFRRTSPNSHISLPRRYNYADRENHSRNPYKLHSKQTYKYWQRQQPLSIPITTEIHPPSMPTFESVPKDIDTTHDVIAPIFIYNGPKGELIMNTMLSTQKHPMQEPVPGEILYPPTAPIFRPRPIVQRFRMPGRKETMNITLIPFYAYEAIVPRFLNNNANDAVNITNSEKYTNPATDTTPLPSAVIYVASTPSKPSSATTTTTASLTIVPTKKPAKKRRNKKAKDYTVYRSPEKVHWQPTKSTLHRHFELTTSYSMVLDCPLLNHRFSNNAITEMTTPRPITSFNLAYKDDDSNFQIVYLDESLEKPLNRGAIPTHSPSKRVTTSSTPKPLPLLSPHYGTDREYYASPVYTLSKLMKPDTSVKPFHYSTLFPKHGNRKKSSEKNVDTWFVMNSRYKGHRTRDGFHRLSSKYVEGPPATTKEYTEETTETTLETSFPQK